MTDAFESFPKITAISVASQPLIWVFPVSSPKKPFWPFFQLFDFCLCLILYFPLMHQPPYHNEWDWGQRLTEVEKGHGLQKKGKMKRAKVKKVTAKKVELK